MGTATQVIWSATSGLLLVPRSAETTIKPFTSAQTTGAEIFHVGPIVNAEEQEWALLLSSERKRLARKRIKPRAVNKAIRQLRYGR
jgi:hypothetical protein